MATIPTRRGAVIHGELNVNDLVKTIAAVAPAASDDMRAAALRELKSSIDSFRMSYSYSNAVFAKADEGFTDSNGRRVDLYKREREGKYLTRGNVGEEREALAAFAQKLRACVEASKKLPLDALSAACHECGPIGGLRQVLDKWASAASKAAQGARKKPDSPTDYAPGWLAGQVACVLRNTLQMRVSMTTDRIANGKRGGAGYARLLRATLEAAGANVPENLRPIMKDGMNTFRDK